MTNQQAIYNLCNATVNTFYPDAAAIAGAMAVQGIDPETEAAAKDPAIFRCVKMLVAGYVEGSRSENGVSASVRSDDAVKRALRRLCREFGLDEEEELDGLGVTIDNATNLW